MGKNSGNKLALVSLLITSDIQCNMSAIADAVERAHEAECRINSFESHVRWPSFGGSLVVSSDGQIIAETRIGEPSFLVCDFPKPV